MTVIKAKPEHAESICDIEHLCWYDDREATSLDQDEWETMINSEVVICYLGDDGILGTALLKECSDGDYEVERIFTHPDHQGQGIATALLENAVDFVKSQSAIAFARVLEDNEYSLRAFETAGFTEGELQGVSTGPQTTCLIYTP